MNLNIWQIIFLALLQGVTELFPISSLGHSVIIPGLLGWGNLNNNTSCGGQSCFLPIIVALHLGTSIALVIYFWRDWLQIILTIVKNIKEGEVRTGTDDWVRSEEHTSELQSLAYLVCRLLLEKKKKKINIDIRDETQYSHRRRCSQVSMCCVC